jgi:hypothetical protein
MTVVPPSADDANQSSSPSGMPSICSASVLAVNA